MAKKLVSRKAPRNKHQRPKQQPQNAVPATGGAAPGNDPGQQPETIENVVERVREVLRQGLAATAPVGKNTQAQVEFSSNVLLENLIRAHHGDVLLEVPEHLQPPPTPLYDNAFLNEFVHAFVKAEQKGGQQEATRQLLTFIDYMRGKRPGAPLKLETGDIGAKVYKMLIKGRGDNIATALCDSTHKRHTKRCYDRLYQRAKRYAHRVGLDWPVPSKPRA
jgi:hypothetical protein